MTPPRHAKKIWLFLCIISLAMISACEREAVNTLEYGPRTLTGTLIRADVSLIRRGTHILQIDSIPAFFVESKTVNVSQFEKGTVVVEGVVEPNTGKADLPVIVATSIRKAAGDDALHTWEIPTLNIVLSVRATWGATIVKRVASFVQVGQTEPILLIRIASGSILPPGRAYFIQNRRAVRVGPVLPRLAEDLYVQDGASVLHMHFDPQTQMLLREEERDTLKSDFERIIQSLSFLSDKGHVTRVTGTGGVRAGEGTICGGTAGILCSAGFYCEIDNTEFGTGKCKAR